MILNTINKEKTSILIVDDDQTIRDVLQLSLEHRGYSVDTADNGQQAIINFVTHKYDLVITDIEMPVMGGNELCKTINQHSPDIPIIAITGMSSKAAAPFQKVYQKPFRATQIAQAVKEFMSTGENG